MGLFPPPSDLLGLPTDPEAAGDGSVIAILKRQRTLLGTIAGAVVVLGGLTFIGSRLATNTVAATATAAAPTYGEATDVKLSTDLAGNLRTVGGGGGGGNPAGGWLDSLRADRLTTGQAHVGRATIDSILANYTHTGRVAIDSILAGQTHIGRVAVDTVVGTVTTTGGAADSVQLRTGQRHAGRVAVDSILANQTHIGRTTLDSILANQTHIGRATIDSILANQTHVGRVAVDSILANQTHVGRVAVDSFVGDATNGVPIRATLLSVTVAPAANTGGTVTLPAVAGQFHYITHIRIARAATAALAGTATLAVTTTNLAGAPQWRVGNAMVAGGTQVDVDQDFNSPLKSTTVNTATTVVLPVPGAAVLWTATVWYYTAP